MQHRTSTTSAASVGGSIHAAANYGEIFTHASFFCVPVPLERYERPRPAKRRKAPQLEASASTSSLFSAIASTITGTSTTTSSSAQTLTSQTGSSHRLWTHLERLSRIPSAASASASASASACTSPSTATAIAAIATSAHASCSSGNQPEDSGATSPCTETSGSHLYQCPTSTTISGTTTITTTITTTASSTGTGTDTSWSPSASSRASSSAPLCGPPPPTVLPSVHVHPGLVPASPGPLQGRVPVVPVVGASASTDAAGGSDTCTCTGCIGHTGMSLVQLSSPAAATPSSAAFAELEVQVDVDTPAGHSSDNNLNLNLPHSATSSSSSPAPPPPPSSNTAPPKSAATAAAAVSASAKATKAAASRLSRRIHLVRPADGLFSIDLKNASSHVYEDATRSSAFKQMNGLLQRLETSSSNTNTSTSARTMNSLDHSITGDNANSRLFVQRNGRTYFSDTTNPYPLPVDLAEIHRQTLRTLMLIQVFGAPVISPSIIKKPPTRVLEMGCGSGFWSMLCHQFFKARGHSGISFTGIDIAPLAPDSGPGMGADSMKPDSDMKWTFIQHDLRQWPWPLPSEEFDLIVSKDMGFFAVESLHPHILAEFNRILRPGGVLEIWDSDHVIRMLRPHVAAAISDEDADEQLVASSLGIYVISPNTPFSPPLNPYLVDYNQWLLSGLQSRELSAVPCALVASILLQETETLGDIRSRRMAIPLCDIRWEREGVGGVITKDGKPNVDSKGGEQGPRVERKALSAGQLALRQTAMLTVVQQVQALEPMLREVSGKSQDEWDVWLSKMMGDLLSEGGASWGECLEVGAFSATKKVSTLP